MVWTSALQEQAASVGDHDQLGHRTAGIYFSGPRKSMGFANVYGDAVEDPARVHHTGSLYGNCLFIIWRDTEVEQRRLILTHRRRSLLYF